MTPPPHHLTVASSISVAFCAYNASDVAIITTTTASTVHHAFATHFTTAVSAIPRAHFKVICLLCFKNSHNICYKLVSRLLCSF
jgi:hypothetical protein